MDSGEIERLIRANVDKTVTVIDVDDEIQIAKHLTDSWSKCEHLIHA
jgi:hypothetical protein